MSTKSFNDSMSILTRAEAGTETDHDLCLILICACVALGHDVVHQYYGEGCTQNLGFRIHHDRNRLFIDEGAGRREPFFG